MYVAQRRVGSVYKEIQSQKYKFIVATTNMTAKEKITTMTASISKPRSQSETKGL